MEKSVWALYKNLAESDIRMMNALQGEFEDILGVKVDPKFFKSLYIDAKYFPGFSTVFGGLQPIYLESKGRLPAAANFLYKKFSRKAFDRTTLPAEQHKLLNQILAQGYCVVENFLNTAQVEKFKDEMNLLDYYAGHEQTIKKYKVGQLRNDSASNDPGASVYHSKFTGCDIEKDSEIGRSMINPFIANIASTYFQSQAYLTDITGIFTKAKDPKSFTTTDFRRNAQSWHVDYPNFRFLTCFLYLTDVKPENGPHTFAVNTHEEKLIWPKEEKDFLESGFRRYANGQMFGKIKDEWVLNAVGSERIKEFCCPKGTLIIENTSGLHKGGYCYAGSREVIAYTYSISNTACPSNQPVLNYTPDFPYDGHLVPVLKSLKQEQENKYNAFMPKTSFTTKMKGQIKSRIKALVPFRKILAKSAVK